MDIQFKPIQNGIFVHHRKDPYAQTSDLHYHDAYELYYLLGGERKYLTHSKLYPIDADWVTLTRPYVIHGTNGQKYERLLVSFSEDFLSSHFSPAMIEAFRQVFSVDAIPAEIIKNNPQIKDLFFQVVDEVESGEIKMAAMHLGTLLLMLHNAVQQIPVGSNNSTLSTQMQEVLAYVSNNLATIKTLEQVASHFYVSKYYLSHQFKNSTGFTFIEFLTKVKISRALHLLKYTDNSIAEIAESCGFETPTYFGVVFKKKLHMTPLQYRTWIIAQDRPQEQPPTKHKKSK